MGLCFPVGPVSKAPRNSQKLSLDFKGHPFRLQILTKHKSSLMLTATLLLPLGDPQCRALFREGKEHLQVTRAAPEHHQNRFICPSEERHRIRAHARARPCRDILSFQNSSSIPRACCRHRVRKGVTPLLRGCWGSFLRLDFLALTLHLGTCISHSAASHPTSSRS